MKQFIGILILFFSFSINMLSQTDSVYTGVKNKTSKFEKGKNDEWKKRLTYGGNFQALFGTVTYIYLTPTIGYIPAKNLYVGIGGIYNYTSVNYSGYGRFSQSIFGGHSYARYLLSPAFFMQLQFDKLYQPDWFSPVDPTPKVWVDYLLAGAGYNQRVGPSVAFNTSLMYNLTPHRLSIYPSRFILQLGFTAKFK